MLNGSTGGRNATWAAAEDLKTTVTKSWRIKHTLLHVSGQKCWLEGGNVSVL